MERDSIQTLCMSLITPQKIASDPRPALEVLDDVLCGQSSNKFSKEKIKAFMDRPDVTGFTAFKVLERLNPSGWYHEPETHMFTYVLELYIKKFIKHGRYWETLRYAILTLHFWTHFNPSGESIKDPEVAQSLPLLRPIIIALIRRWSVYKQSAIALMHDIETDFSKFRHHGNATLPGETESHFIYTYDNHVQQEFKRYILPFIGKVLIELAVKGWYAKPDQLYELATRESFGNKDTAGWLYIRSIAQTFTLDEIKPFMGYEGKENDYLLSFLQSPEGASIKSRLIELCKQAPAKTVYELLHRQIEYAGVRLSDNLEYKNMSLTEKGNFIAPFAISPYTTYVYQQQSLVRLWINDPEWRESKKPLAELILIALRNRRIFPQGAGWLFEELMRFFLERITTKEEIDAMKARYESALKGMDKYKWDSAIRPEHKNSPALALILTDMVGARYDLRGRAEENWFQQIPKNYAWDMVESAFLDLVAGCLSTYTVKEMCEVIELAKATKHKRCMEIVTQQKLNVQQSYHLLGLMTPGHREEVCKATLESAHILRDSLIKWVHTRSTDRGALYTALKMLHRHWWCITPEQILPAVLERKSFSKLSTALDIIHIYIRERTYDSKELKELIRSHMISYMGTKYRSYTDALCFCQHMAFYGNHANWSWFYGKYPVRKLRDLKLSPLQPEVVAGMVIKGNQQEAFLRFWKGMRFRKMPRAFLIKLSKENISFDQHPEWQHVPLAERLSFFEHYRYESGYDCILQSIKVNFGYVWKRGKWDVEKYLKAIEHLYNSLSEDLAKLAIPFA